ncbi:MAG: protein kinase [Deltaproteobacteria bacterium]|jgi:WD40 repeat protein/serine/threonine protein kinase|nr:protein kinase [Deltaproteobacteria bacterium]
MNESDKTVLDPGATMPDNDKAPDLTVLETGPAETGSAASDLTVLEPGTKAPDLTVLDPGTSGDYRPGDLVLGIYRVESQAIESGGMGRVWRVRHAGWNSDLAMKRPRAEFFVNEKHKADFTRECEEWIRLGLHPNIVSCYYVREIDNIPCIFSEWMDGGSLAEAIESGSLHDGEPGQVRKRILDIAVQFARGLRYANERKDADGRDIGLIHQDVKPGNLLLSKDGAAKVSDFGLAKAHVLAEASTTADFGGPASDTTKTKLAAGGGYTPAYCSMEQMDGLKLTRRTDIYSWAVSVMEMCLGSRPWTNGVVAGLKCSEYLKLASPPMPEALRELLTQCLASEQENRPHDFGVVEERLLEIYKAETGEAYFRPPGGSAGDTASSLNNHALSYLDLGRPAEAEKCWNRALAILPDHSESIYNHAVFQWMEGKIDDLEAVRRVTIPDINSNYYLSMLHLARGDANKANECLAKAKGAFGETDKIKNLSETIEEMIKEKNDGINIDILACETIKTKENTFIRSITCSRDGSKALIRSKIGLNLLDLNTKKYICEIEGNHFAASLSPDGKRAIAACGDGRIRIYDLSSGKCLHNILTPRKENFSVCYSPDGNKALFQGEKREVIIWNINAGRCEQTLTYPPGVIFLRISSICFSSDGKLVLIHGDNRDMVLFRLETGESVKFSPGHFTIVFSAFSPDGEMIITSGYASGFVGSHEKEVKFWDINTLMCLRTFSGSHLPVKSISLSPDAKNALSISEESDVKLWDTSTGRCVRTFDAPGGKANSVCFLPDGAHGLSSWSGSVSPLKLLRMPNANPPNYILSQIHSTDAAISQKKLFDSYITEIHGSIAENDISKALEKMSKLSVLKQYGNSQTYYDTKRKLARFCVRNKATAIIASMIKCRSKVLAMSFDSTGDMIFSGEDSCGEINLWDITTHKLVRTFPASHPTYCPNMTICLDKNNKMLLSGSCNRMPHNTPLRLWDVEKGVNLINFTDSIYDDIRAVCFSPDGRSVISASHSDDKIKKLKIWDVDTGKCTASFDQDSSTSPRSVSYSPNGQELIVGYQPLGENCDTLVLWNVKSQKKLHIFLHGQSNAGGSNFHPAGMNAVGAVFTPTGTAVLSAAASGGNAILWDLKTRQELKIFPVEVDKDKICVSPDGKKILVVGDKGKLNLLDVDSGACVQTISSQPSYSNFCFNFDGTKIASAYEDNIIVYELDYDLVFPGWADWDDGAAPYVETFLTLHPDHTDADFENLLTELGNRGYGWLRPEGVRDKLETLKNAPAPKKGFFSSLFGKK